jgi:hypothetical protein
LAWLIGATGTNVSFSMLSGRDIRGDLDDFPTLLDPSARLPFDTDLRTVGKWHIRNYKKRRFLHSKVFSLPLKLRLLSGVQLAISLT